jgi:hypothetical protein
LNYLEYKKDFDPNAHVRIFKVVIKANGETIDEEITNLSNFTLKDNASIGVTINYMQNNPNYRFVDRTSFL